MAVEPEFRFAILYLLLFRWGIAALFKPRADGSAVPGGFEKPSWIARSTRRAVQMLFVLPVLLWALAPHWLGVTQLNPHPLFRWLALVPAAMAILLSTWADFGSGRPASKSEGDGALSPPTAGPFRWIRYPREAAQVAFYVSVAWLTANIAPLLTAFAGAILVRCVFVSRLESTRRRRDLQSEEVPEGGQGLFLPDLGPVAQRQYSVPKRFGMAAIIALMTVLGVVFGALRYWEAHPAIYLFVSSEIVAVCLAQIIFGSRPRWACTITGAVLLPFWVALTTDRPAWLRFEYFLLIHTALAAFGGLLGYCLGALAAGFFLVMDLVDTWLPGGESEGPNAFEGTLAVSRTTSPRTPPPADDP